jgi:4'-phosphopantetheinyl transferase
MTATEVHLWALPLAASPKAVEAFQSYLSPEEKARAERFVFPRHREAYTLSQGALRLLLSDYLKIPPLQIQLDVGPKGKPSVRDEPELTFNKSHSNKLALYAIAKGCAIGVDLEELRELPGLDEIASHYFCAGEALELSSLGGMSERQEAFFRCWTRKEAYIKAVGDGLSIPLDQFQVTLLPDHPARFVHIGDDERTASEWRLHHLEPAIGYVGALAYRGEQRAIRFQGALDCDDLLAKSVSLGCL